MRCSVDKTPDCVENQAFFKEYIQIPAHYTSGKHKLKFSICQTLYESWYNYLKRHRIYNLQAKAFNWKFTM